MHRNFSFKNSLHNPSRGFADLSFFPTSLFKRRGVKTRLHFFLLFLPWEKNEGCVERSFIFIFSFFFISLYWKFLLRSKVIFVGISVGILEILVCPLVFFSRCPLFKGSKWNFCKNLKHPTRAARVSRNFSFLNSFYKLNW